ncbi:hypothetical protein SCLCIDRAFT_1223105 [Scleroderma citrinum Foug A]|uniref:Uncharacterized protein n=1 Tax=Scleroderma citrinum Foug A TaxID=1036808 RepID=A0A0C3DAK7_9AGAM|nr:hypothetical protein SCLCIDRAFT_1223105 [Scleroderma citrinum Foug A]
MSMTVCLCCWCEGRASAVLLRHGVRCYYDERGRLREGKERRVMRLKYSDLIRSEELCGEGRGGRPQTAVEV